MGQNMAKAIFLDRDGVLNPLVWNPLVHDYDSPHRPEEVTLLPGVPESLQFFCDSDYLVFVISNQPSAAKGKCSLDNLKAVQARFESLLSAYPHARILESFYCYHHPEAVIPEFKQKCRCRKPGNYFLELVHTKYQIDMSSSWMIGDRDIDVLCGKSMGTKTILLDYPHSVNQRNGGPFDYSATDLAGATGIIKKVERGIQRG